MKTRIVTLLFLFDYSCSHECYFLVRFSRIFDMKVVNHLLSVHKFIVVSVISIEIVVIVLSFNSILKSSSISSKVQYIVDLSFVLIVYHY